MTVIALFRFSQMLLSSTVAKTNSTLSRPYSGLVQLGATRRSLNSIPLSPSGTNRQTTPKRRSILLFNFKGKCVHGVAALEFRLDQLRWMRSPRPESFQAFGTYISDVVRFGGARSGTLVTRRKWMRFLIFRAYPGRARAVADEAAWATSSTYYQDQDRRPSPRRPHLPEHLS
jgi:hypothetical protein